MARSSLATPIAAPPTHASPASHVGSPPLQLAHSPAPPAQPANAIKPLAEVEREQILRTLDRFGGNRTRAAEALGIGVRTLGLKLKKWKQQNLVAQTV